MSWTAFYAPKRIHTCSGFTTESEARAYTKGRYDEDAWIILETRYFKKCKNNGDVYVGAGFYPSITGTGKPAIHTDRWLKYEEACRRIGRPVQVIFGFATIGWR